MDFLFADFTQMAFWVAVLQIIGVNIILSGDNAVVIALACMHLPPKQRLWGMILGAGVAVLLRILFTLVVAQAMGYPYLKLVGGLLLLWVAVKLVVPEPADGEGKVESADNLWRAVWIVTIADIVQDPHYLARADIVTVPDDDFGSVRMQGVVPRFAATPGEVRHAGRSLGADNRAIYGDRIGLDAAELARLTAAGVI